MRRSHRQSLVVWSSSATPLDRHGAGRLAGARRVRRVRRGLRTGALLAVIGLMYLARVVRTRREAMLLLTGAAFTAAGIILPSGMIVIAGMMALLRGVAVALGVSESRYRPDRAPAGRADFFGFGTPPLRHGNAMKP